MNSSTKSLLHWYDKNSRPLPWRETTDPYKIWISEIFLQQTQALRVVDYYLRTIEKFPTVFDLASASWEDFFPYFKGLGFYSRGKNMLKCAQFVVEHWDGKFSDDVKELQKLPGVGKYTASAIASFAYKKDIPALDTNLYRVMGRFFDTQNEKEIEKKSDYFYASGSGDALNHAFMDLGSSLCTSKKAECENCPLQKNCQFFLQGKKVVVQKKKVKRVNAFEFSVCVLHHEKKYFVIQKSGKNGFPIFFNAEKKDHRHFLQDMMLKKYGIEISVRPAFEEKIEENCNFFSEILKGLPQKNAENLPVRFRFSRCQIQGGKIENFLSSQEKNFYLPKNFSELSFEEIIDSQLLSRVISMKM